MYIPVYVLHCTHSLSFTDLIIHTGDDSVDSLVFFFESGRKEPFEDIIISLVEDENLAWYLSDYDQKRASFLIKNAFDLSLISHPYYLELQVSKPGYSELLLPEMCILARDAIVNVMKAEHQNFHLAFKCTCHRTPDVHLMKISSSEAQPTQAECHCSLLDQELFKEHLIWFVSARLIL